MQIDISNKLWVNVLSFISDTKPVTERLLRKEVNLLSKTENAFTVITLLRNIILKSPFLGILFSK